MHTPGNDQNMSTSDLFEERILEHINHPKELEQLFRIDKTAFKKAFNTIFSEISGNSIAQVWNERLNAKEEAIGGPRMEWIMLGISIFLAGMLVKIPAMTGIDEEFFYSRNLPFLVIPFLTAYFAWKSHIEFKSWGMQLIAFLVSAVYINLLPDNSASDTLTLACIHLPIFLWSLAGFAFTGNEISNKGKRVEFLRYNGDLVVICALLALAGFLFSGITIGLFQLIGLKVGDWYAQYVIAWGAPAIPLTGTFLVRNNPNLVNKISPLIARIFTPLVFLMLLIFLGAVIYTGKDPYNDREFLLLFNILLIGVMAIILFSLSEATKNMNQRIQLITLFGLALLAIIANGIALSAISFRIFEYGMTPNRIAVLGSNLLIFSNLIGVAFQLLNTLQHKTPIQNVTRVIAFFLPIYGGWAAAVAFLIPLVFKFK